MAPQSARPSPSNWPEMNYTFLIFASALLAGGLCGIGYRLRVWERSRYPAWQARVWYTHNERGRLRRYSITPPGCSHTDERAIHLSVIPEEAGVEVHLAAFNNAQGWAAFYTKRGSE